jgi:hypothetical protein
MNNNLDYCDERTKKDVNFILENPCTSDFAKRIIKEGLTKDCLDVIAYLDDATKALQIVLDNINK